MKFVNLTPHTVTIGRVTGPALVLPASGQVARVSAAQIDAKVVDGIKCVCLGTGEVTGLPDGHARCPYCCRVNCVSLAGAETCGVDPNSTVTDDTIYIVSAQVRLAVPHRKDVASPGELIRDGAGQPIGCNGLIVN